MAMKLYFKDTAGELRVLESEIQLDINLQNDIKAMIAREAGIITGSAVLSVIDGGKNA